MLSLDLRGLGSGVLINVLESILILTLDELILLIGNSLLVALQVGIGSSLGSSGGSEISVLSSGDESLGTLIISSLESSIKGSLLSVNSGTVGSLSSLERSSVLVVSSSESSGGIGLGSTSSGISSSGSSSRGGSGGLGSVGIVVSDGGTVEMLGLGNIVGL